MHNNVPFAVPRIVLGINKGFWGRIWNMHHFSGSKNTQNVFQLVEVMLPGEDGPVGEHLGEDAADGPDVDGLGVALQRERDRDPAAPAM